MASDMSILSGDVDFYPNGGWSQPCNVRREREMTDSDRRLSIVACVSHALNVIAQTALSLISTFSVESKEISFPHEKYQRINQILSF